MQELRGGSIILGNGNLESTSLSLGLAKFLSHQKLARELICPKECYPDTDQQQLYFYIQTYLYSSYKLNFVKADLKPEVILQK